MKFCPKCGSAIMPGSNMCTNCGEVINNVSNNVVSTPVVELPVETPVMPILNQPQPMMETQQPVESPQAMVTTLEVVEQPIINTSMMMETPVVETTSVPYQPQMESDVNNVVSAPVVELPVETSVVPTFDQPQPMMEAQPPIESFQQVSEPTEVVTQPVIDMPITSAPIMGEQSVTPITSQVGLEVEGSQPSLSNQLGDESGKTNLVGSTKLSEANEKSNKVPLTSEEKEKKFNRIVTIIIIILSLLAIVVTVLFLIKTLSKEEGETGSTVVVATQYTYEGFNFYLPSDVVASVEEEQFVIRDNDNTWSAVITIQDGTYNTLVSNKSQIASYFENYGYIATDAEEVEISGVSFVTTEVLMGSKNVLVAYAKASGTKIYGIVYVNQLGTYDNYSLKTIGEILAATVNSGYDSALPEGFTIDIFKETFEVAK